MKALSMKQPWAWLVAVGFKDIENRKWSTKFRGRIYIHASKTFDYDGFNWLCSHPNDHLDRVGMSEWAIQAVYPTLGAIIGEVTITDCVTKRCSPWFFGPYGFLLVNPVLYAKIIPCKGQLGLFDPKIEEILL